MPFKDFREYLSLLEKKSFLKRVKAEVNKDWEISSIARLVYTELPEEKRYALLFEKVKGYDVPVVVGAIGASRAVYAAALETNPDRILERWLTALTHPIEPIMTENAPCKENVCEGEKVDITNFPIPIWTPGKDGAPYITSPYVITKDPDTGIRNVGTYRMMIKGKNKTGITVSPVQHIGAHYAKYEERGEPMPIAVVIGADPTIGMTSVAKVPLGTDELSIAGGLRKTPIELVKCETVDLEVPATAEIVLEGEVPPKIREVEGPFGEFVGYLTPKLLHPIVNIKCIACRNNPIYQAFVSQKPPSESSKVKGIGIEASIYKHLVHDHQIPGILDVHVTESSAVQGHIIVKIKKKYPGHAQQVLHTCWTVTAYGGGTMLGKIISVMDEDIDIRDLSDLDWAYNYRVQPDRDITIIPSAGLQGLLHDFSIAPPTHGEGEAKQGLESEFKGAKMEGSKMLIDATKKWSYPELALPPKECLDRAKARWKAGKYNLPLF